ncbi:DUF3397 family protein [Loigolactobacillus zhaoyuanensis]|uniref:DUF3397 family protein n=1 Tax=Loigolactobacillus zhaoyuanensis TaxID=2486017 RepID=UPI000F7358FF|nr:DUF3397 family protein [Loigolactobacillus zhaoyuanensis]
MLVLGVLLPVIGLIIGVVMRLTHFKWRIAPVDWVTFSLLLASDILIWIRYRYQATSLLIVIMAIMAIFVAVSLAWRRGEILYRTFLKIWWRLLFAPSLLAYLILVVLQWY